MIPDRLRALITRRIRYRLTSGGAIFFGAMYAGGEAMQAFTPTNIQYSLAQVIQAVVVFCVATPALIVEIFRLTDNGRFRSTGSSGGWSK